MNEQEEEKYITEILSDEYPSADYIFKIILIGDSGVGKTCLSTRAMKNIFEPNYNVTIAFEFYSMNIKVNDKIIKLQIWDTCGQEIYRSLISNFYRSSSLAIVMYAINDKNSFKSIDYWINEVKTYSQPGIKLFLIGNKKDLEKQREVTKEDVEIKQKEHEFSLFIESSAKTGLNVKDIFIKAACILYKENKNNIGNNTIFSEDDFNNTEQMNNSKKENKKNKCGC